MAVDDLAALKLADAALGIADPSAAAEALRLQPGTVLINQPFSWREAKRIARESPTGDWSRIVARSRLQPGLPPTTTDDLAILAAINAVQSADTDIIDPASPAWQGGLAALQGVGDLSTATALALHAIGTVTPLPWKDVDAGDVQTARAIV